MQLLNEFRATIYVIGNDGPARKMQSARPPVKYYLAIVPPERPNRGFLESRRHTAARRNLTIGGLERPK